MEESQNSLATTDAHMLSLGKLLKHGVSVFSSGKQLKYIFFQNEYQKSIYLMIFGAHQILKYQHNIVSFMECVYKHKQKANKAY